MTRLLLIALLALPSFAPWFASVPPPSDREHWITIDAGDLQIFSNAGERETTEIANNLVRMREAIGRITQLKVRSAVPTNVYVFRNEGSFNPFRDATLGRRANISGLFISGSEANFIMLQADAPGGIDRVVYHELTHYFVKNTLAGLPLWFHEGIAEYYSTFSTTGDNVDLGKPIKEHVMWLRDQPLIPLAQLFAMDEKSKDYNEGSRQGVFYAESWALLHYLLTGSPERKEQLPKFLGLLKAKQPVDVAFRVAFNTSYEEMERELKGYVRRFSFTYRRYPLADLAIKSVPAPKLMSRADVYYRLGDLLARGTIGGASSDAERFLAAAIAENKEHAGAYATLAMVHDAAGRGAEAQVEYERAVRFGSNDPNVYLFYGATVLRNAANAMRGQSAPKGELDRARKLFTRAAELAPTSARALAGIGATYVISDEDPTPGIAALEKSLALAAGQDDVAVNLAQLYARTGRRAEASRVFESVSASRTPEQVREAREALLSADLDRAQTLLQDDKASEALPILKSVLSQTSNETLKAKLMNAIAEIEGHVAADKQAVEINKAIELANKGKLAEALAVIDAILPQITDAELRESTKNLRADMEKASKQKKKR